MVKSSSSDYKCDVSSYTVVVCVRYEENGQLGKPDIIIKNNNGRKSEILAYNYVSIFSAKNPEGGGKTPQTGDCSQIEIWIMLFAASTWFILLLLVKRSKDDPEQEEYIDLFNRAAVIKVVVDLIVNKFGSYDFVRTNTDISDYSNPFHHIVGF